MNLRSTSGDSGGNFAASVFAVLLIAAATLSLKALSSAADAFDSKTVEGCRNASVP